jgi:hypothetical protein
VNWRLWVREVSGWSVLCTVNRINRPGHEQSDSIQNHGNAADEFVAAALGPEGRTSPLHVDQALSAPRRRRMCAIVSQLNLSAEIVCCRLALSAQRPNLNPTVLKRALTVPHEIDHFVLVRSCEHLDAHIMRDRCKRYSAK